MFTFCETAVHDDAADALLVASLIDISGGGALSATGSIVSSTSFAGGAR